MSQLIDELRTVVTNGQAPFDEVHLYLEPALRGLFGPDDAIIMSFLNRLELLVYTEPAKDQRRLVLNLIDEIAQAAEANNNRRFTR